MIVALCGPIEWWWGERFNTPEAKAYREWRENVTFVLVDDGHLVYRPHEAFKGEWDGNDGDALGQLVNDAAILASDVIVDMTPMGVISDGTAKELQLCKQHRKPVIACPPPRFTSAWDGALVDLVNDVRREEMK